MSDPFDELDAPTPKIKISCTSTDCEKDLHCFRQKRTKAGTPVFGPCRDCRTDPVFDIARIRRRDAGDIAYTFKALRHELIRAHMWETPFDRTALAHARKKGRKGLNAAVMSRLRSSIGKPANAWDGQQTKMHSNAIFYAQHATATCCRKCLAYWFDIPRDRDLKPDELAFGEALVIAYLDKRLPDLADDPVKDKPKPR